MKDRIVATIIVVGLFATVAAFWIGAYAVEESRQETIRARICTDAGGRWTTGWNWRTYCWWPK